jgi:hypothetical protein
MRSNQGVLRSRYHAAPILLHGSFLLAQTRRYRQHLRLQLAIARASGPMAGLGQAGMEDDTTAVVPVVPSLLQQPAAQRQVR